MKCKKAQTLIPDYRIGDLSPRLKKALEAHLSVCPICSREAEFWEQVCHFSLNAAAPPDDLNWAPFDDALQRELKRNPTPGRQGTAWSDIRHALSELWNYPRKSAFRLAFSVAAVLFVVFLAGHIRTLQRNPGRISTLTIGEPLTSVQQQGVIYYRGTDDRRAYIQETINLESLEGMETQNR